MLIENENGQLVAFYWPVHPSGQKSPCDKQLYLNFTSNLTDIQALSISDSIINIFITIIYILMRL